MNGMPVVLRDERSGPDVRHLYAWCDEKGNLHIDGRDMGPGTAPVSDDGEYEWFQEIAAADLPRVRELLDAPEDANILDVLTNWTDARSYELERLLRESSIPIKRFVT